MDVFGNDSAPRWTTGAAINNEVRLLSVSPDVSILHPYPPSVASILRTSCTAHLCHLTNTKNFVNGISLTQLAETNNASSFFPSPHFSPHFSDSFLFRPVLGELLRRASFSSSPQESCLNGRKVMTTAPKLSFVCC